MILTVDIGNTLIGIGVFEDSKLITTLSLQTRKGEQVDHYYSTLLSLFASLDKKIVINRALIASVVPLLTNILSAAIKKLFKVEPLVLQAGIKTGILLKVDHPMEVGADIVAVAAGAFSFGKGPFILIDLGTANKYFYVDENHVFSGVAISPGLHTSFNALVEDADQLLSVPFSFPKKVLGKNTKDSLASGLMYGLLDEVNGFIKRIEEETGKKGSIIITGGNAIHIKDYIDKSIIYEPDLVHYGLLTIIGKNNEK